MRTFLRVTLLLALLLPLGCSKKDSKGTLQRAELNYAISQNDLKKVEELVKAGCDLSSADTDDNHATPLMWAINDNRKDMVTYLLDHGANVNVKDTWGRTALCNAIAGSDANADLVAALIKHGADVNSVDENGTSILVWASHPPAKPRILKLLTDAGAK